MADVGAELEITPTPSGWQLRGELDAHTAPSLGEAMATLPDGEVRIGMGEVTFVDSSGLRTLLDATNRARAAGGDLVLDKPTVSVRRLIELSGLSGHMRIRG